MAACKRPQGRFGCEHDNDGACEHAHKGKRQPGKEIRKFAKASLAPLHDARGDYTCAWAYISNNTFDFPSDCNNGVGFLGNARVHYCWPIYVSWNNKVLKADFAGRLKMYARLSAFIPHGILETFA